MYEGEFDSDAKSGSGTLYSEDGTLSYKGEWLNDSPNGIGTTMVNGVLQTGRWTDGEYVG